MWCNELILQFLFRHRLGPFGFLYQDDGSETAARGNFAIYDQIEALKWVKKYIRNFGGNPNSVSIDNILTISDPRSSSRLIAGKVHHVKTPKKDGQRCCPELRELR